MDKIDFVMTWVDGSDENWIKEKNTFQGDFYVDSTDTRYRDWELLKYWFRGVEKYAPWVNKIFFVTWGHIPTWLNTDHEKLVVVKHKEYIPDQYLPTFNSHVIELNLFRIKALSEKFVYFNDDTFIINKTIPEDFFKLGLPCDTAVLNPFIPSKYTDVNFVGNNNISVINQNFIFRNVMKANFAKFFNLRYGMQLIRTILTLPYNKFVGFREYHFPNPLLKSTFQRVWEKEYDILDTTSKSHFRDVKTNVNQWLIREWQFAEGKFYPRSPSVGVYFDLSNDIDKVVKILLNSRKKLICLNDSEDIYDFEKRKQDLIAAFEVKFSHKSGFER